MPNIVKPEPPFGTLAGTQVPATAMDAAVNRPAAATVSIKVFRILVSSRGMLAKCNHPLAPESTAGRPAPGKNPMPPGRRDAIKRLLAETTQYEFRKGYWRRAVT